MSKGKKYCLPPALRSVRLPQLIIANLAASAPFDRHFLTRNVKEIISSSTDHVKKCSGTELNTYLSIKNKLSKNNVVLVKADKGASIIALDRPVYIGKVMEYLNSVDAEVFDDLNFQQYAETTRKKILTEVTLISSYPTRKSLLMMNPQPPLLYGQIKNHKPNQPIRPVVASYTSPVYRLSKFLASWFTTYTKYEFRYTVKNSKELANELIDLHLPAITDLVSFDVVNMFNVIPVQDTVNIMIEIISRKCKNKKVIQEFRGLLLHSTKLNFCWFNGHFYKFKTGLPMGGPLSSLIANIYMDHFENYIIPTVPDNIFLWRRYVDDVFCMWTGSRTQLDSFLERINAFNKNVQFTLEFGDRS